MFMHSSTESISKENLEYNLDICKSLELQYAKKIPDQSWHFTFSQSPGETFLGIGN